jgi:hypothetical protein
MDRLFEVSLARFVEERKKLAKELRDAGQRALAKQVGEIPKPTPPAWALNQVARRSPALVAAYVEALDAQVEAHRAASGREALFAALAAEREASKRVVHEAVRALTEDGVRASKATLDSVGELLHEAATHADTRAKLLAGTLLGERSSDGLAALVALVEPGRAEEPAPETTPRPNEREALRREEQRREEEARARAAVEATKREEESRRREQEEARRREQEEARRREQEEAHRKETEAAQQRDARRAALTRELAELDRALARAAVAEREAELELEAARLKLELARVRRAAAETASRELREEIERA